MKLREFFSLDAIALDLPPSDRTDMLAAMVGLLHTDEPTQATLRGLLERREQLGSTGVGRGIAIPHCRAQVVPHLRVAFARVPEGLAWHAIDGQPVHYLFLIVAPPLEASNLYLPVLGKLAQFAKAPDVPARLASLTSPEEFLNLLDERDG